MSCVKLQVLSVPQTLECVRILNPFLFTYFNCLPNDILCKFCTLNSSCDKPFDLSQQVGIAYMSCKLILKI